jgi:hypothetical protein
MNNISRQPPSCDEKYFQRVPALLRSRILALARPFKFNCRVKMNSKFPVDEGFNYNKAPVTAAVNRDTIRSTHCNYMTFARDSKLHQFAQVRLDRR